MTLLNITLFCEFGVLKCIYVVQKHIFHILYIIVAPPFLFYKAHRSEKCGGL